MKIVVFTLDCPHKGRQVKAIESEALTKPMVAALLDSMLSNGEELISIKYDHDKCEELHLEGGAEELYDGELVSLTFSATVVQLSPETYKFE